jgi:translation initiation factor 4A
MDKISSWDDINIDADLLRGIYSCGFESPSPIQAAAIAPILEGNNIIAQAQSGTGKTAAFTISSISLVDVSRSSEQVIIISPTRELSKQIHSVVLNLSRFIPRLKSTLLIGGNPIWKDIKCLKSNTPHIIIGCPGRILYCVQQKSISLDDLKLVVLDEADELMSEGFVDQMYDIIRSLNSATKIAVFSATLPDNIRPIVNQLFTTPPMEILVKRDDLTLEGIAQYYVAVSDNIQKYEVLKNIYSEINIRQCIIYCNSVRRVVELYQNLINDGFAVSCIHGDMDKIQREKSFEDFRTGGSRILISSNITARGIDIQQVNIVINYDIPSDVSSYLHRIGRSGRWGRKGTGINFITKYDVKNMRDIETYYNTAILELPACWYTADL